MHVEQIYTGCLAQGAYYIHSNGEAAIIDPLREISPYLERAEKDGVKIKYIFETHFHADFVSGHVSLAEKTGATIVYGPTAKTNFKSHVASDGEIFKIGNITIKALHTPGHTMESTTYLLFDENGKEYSIFSGDTLFLGDVGRPDLAQKSADITQEKLAGILFDSLREKIMPLTDSTIVYPAHGAGSACGKNMMKETVDTLGNQKKMNYALRVNMTKEEFVEEVTNGLMPPPAYFPLNVKMNKEGYQNIDEVLNNGTTALTAEEFETIANEKNALMLDVRSADYFAEAHIPNSIFIGLDGSFAPWVGELIVDVKQPIILVAPEGREKEAVTRLARVGFDNTLGFLKGGIEAWKTAGKEIAQSYRVNAESLATEIRNGAEYQVFDVRKPNEYTSEHILNAKHTALSALNEHLNEFPKEKPFVLHCAGGYRSMIAASMLKQKGFHNFVDVIEGYNGLKKTDLQKSEFVCPSTL